MSERVEIRVPREDLKRWRVAASARGLSLSEWIRRRCNDVAIDQDMLARLLS
jgi:predicted DNA binding CopG/RHH family protein